MKLLIYIQTVMICCVLLSSQNSNASDTITEILSKPVLTEDLILYQIYQESKCNFFAETKDLRLTCMKSFPSKEDGRYLVKFNSGFKNKNDSDEFNSLDEESKNWYVRTQVDFLKDSLNKLLKQTYIPNINSIEEKEIKTHIFEKLVIELRFYFDNGDYLIILKPNEEAKVTKGMNRIKTT